MIPLPVSLLFFPAIWLVWNFFFYITSAWPEGALKQIRTDIQALVFTIPTYGILILVGVIK